MTFLQSYDRKLTYKASEARIYIHPISLIHKTLNNQKRLDFYV